MNVSHEDELFIAAFARSGGLHDIGICYRDPLTGDFHFHAGLSCPPARRGEFVKMAPSGYFLYGATVMVELRSGIVLSPDRRAGGQLMATANGWSSPGETGEAAGNREFTQEVCVWLDGMDLPVGDLRRGERVQLVPKGIAALPRVPMLNLNLTGSREVGALEYVGVNVNETTKVVEFIYRWRLGDHLTADEERMIRMVWTEQMDADRSYLGTNFVVVNPATGEYVGTFCGRQPLLDVRGLAFHGAAAKFVELTKAG